MILGLLILIGALIAGLIFFTDGTGVFSPRAKPETTPQQIRVTNLKSNSFTVSFYTEEATTGFVKYGTEPSKLNSQVTDDRDQLTGTVGEYELHHITVQNLDPETSYYYVLGTGSRANFDNEGEPFEITTAPDSGAAPPEAQAIYGSVAAEAGGPAEGSIVYVTAEGMGDLSSLVRGSGGWAISLSQARDDSGKDYARLGSKDRINIIVQGVPASKKIQHQLTVSEAQPAPDFVFGQSPAASAADSRASETAGPDLPPGSEQQTQGPEPDPGDELTEQSEDATISGHLQDMLDQADPLPADSSASSELVLSDTETSADSTETTYTTQAPKIKGKVKPNVEVTIQVNSENQYEEVVTADANGEFELDLEALGANLEPGEHTVTYSYIDPDTGEEVVRNETFIVEDSEAVRLSQVASAETTDTLADTSTDDSTTTTSTESYGSGDPYPMPEATVTTEPDQTESDQTEAIMPTATPTNSPTPTTSQVFNEATDSTVTARQQPISTDSSPKAGSIEATLLLIIGGMFFLLMGGWSWWLASELEEN